MATIMSTDNPFALIIALGIIFLLVKNSLGKLKVQVWKKQKVIPKLWILPVAILICVVVVTNMFILKTISAALPLFTLLAVVVALGSLVFIALGTPLQRVLDAFGNIHLRVLLLVLTTVIVVFAGSLVVGQQLLDDGSLTLGVSGGISILGEGQTAQTQIDFAPLFSMPALGFFFLIIFGALAVLCVRGLWIFG